MGYNQINQILNTKGLKLTETRNNVKSSFFWESSRIGKEPMETVEVVWEPSIGKWARDIKIHHKSIQKYLTHIYLLQDLWVVFKLK